MPGNEQCIFAGLMADDIKGMNACINKIALEMFSFFDTGKGKQSKPRQQSRSAFITDILMVLMER